MLDDLNIPIDSLSISLGMGLSITLKLGWSEIVWVAVGSHSAAPAAKACRRPWVQFLVAALVYYY